jgi:AraC-like DNA-binding protein/ligand-binding sensor domain-containing protein
MDDEPNFAFISLEKRQLNNAIVSAFSVDEHSFWVGTNGGGLNRMDRRNGKFTYFTTRSKRFPLSADIVKSVVTDRHDNVWIGTYGGGINHLHLATGKIEYLLPDSDNEETLYAKDIRKIVAEGDHGLWVIYELAEPLISYYDRATGKFTHYRLDTEPQMLVDMLPAVDRQIWIIGQKKLYVMNQDTRQTSIIHRPEFDRISFTACCMGSMGSLWLGTAKQGLVKYTPQTDLVEYYPFPDKLKGSTINSMLRDAHSFLWMGTDNGLITYNRILNIWGQYNKADGTQGNIYETGAAMKDRAGRLYFGGTNGFTIVDNDHIGIRTFDRRMETWQLTLYVVCLVSIMLLVGVCLYRRKRRKTAACILLIPPQPNQTETTEPQTATGMQTTAEVKPTAEPQPTAEPPTGNTHTESDIRFLQALNAFIEAHIEQSDISVTMLANEMSSSHTKLFRHVKALTGKNIVQYVLSVRLQKASRILQEQPNLTMREVMAQVGIESQSYFANAFKKEFGESPTAYAKGKDPKPDKPEKES